MTEQTTDRPKRPIGIIVTISLLALAVLIAAIVITVTVLRLDAANNLIEEQLGEIERQDGEIEEQQELIDKKETFGAAMEQLLDTAGSFAGVRTASIIPMDRFQAAATSAWMNRWDAAALDTDIATVEQELQGLNDLLSAASTQATSNATGSTYESVTDRLGAGFVATLVYDATTFCEKEVLACVSSVNPYVVHFDATNGSQPHMNDWLRTGVAYHEYAHVLQFTNPVPTETALAAFGGDVETMADCFALTYLDGWTLEHRVWANSRQYWDVDIGYGYTCNDAQKQVIRDWYEPLGFQVTPISQ